MQTISELKQQREDKQSELFKECGLFFAFSPSQFQENKTPLQESEKYLSIGGGGYLPKNNFDKFDKGMDLIQAWFKSQVKNNKARRQYIAYELANHEAYYTGCITDTLEALGEEYTREEVKQVYREELKLQHAEN